MKNAFILLFFLIGNLGVGNICYAQPSSGITTFDGLITKTITLDEPGEGSASASNVLNTGWTFTVDNLNGSSTAVVQGLDDVGDDKDTIDDDVISLTAGGGLNTEYVSIASSDGSEFQLENFKLYFTSSGNAVVTIAGYRDGSEIVSPSQGSLTNNVWNTIDVSSNTSFDNIDEIRITYGSPNASITRIDDISINPNTPPTFTSLSGSVQSTNEDTGVDITFAEITEQGNEADVDGTVDAFVVKAVSSGTLTINGSAYAATTNNEITAAKSAFWTPATNANGTLNAFTITAKDNAGDESTSGAVQATVSVTAVNDDPTLTGLPASITVTEDVASDVDLSSATFADVDAGSNNVSLVITAAAGTLSAVSRGDVSISNSGTSSINLYGTVSNIDTYLNTASNIQYTTVSNSNTPTSLSFTADDGGNSGAGGGTTISVGSSVTVNITRVNDEPSFTLPGNNLTVSQNAVATTESAFATGMSDNDGNTQNLYFYVSNNNNDIFSAQPDIDETSGDLTFAPVSGAFGKATVSVFLKDGGEETPTGDDTSPTQTFDIFVTPDNIKINEVNAASTTSEFVEIYDGGSGSTSLSDLVLIFYSGSDASDGVYGEEDLSGSTDADGFYVVGETGVTNLDQDWGEFVVQDGTDAVVLYVGSASDFTSGDAPITDGLVDVLVYGSADDSALRTALGGPPLSPAGDASNSISRAIDGTGSFVAQIPSPGVTNDVTPPVSPVVTSPSGSVTVNSASQTLIGTHTEDGVTVHAYADENNDGVADNTTSLGSSTVSGNAWSLSVNLTANAANNFVVQAEDAAGNVSSDVDVPTITEDSTDPVKPVVTSPSGPVIVNSATQTLSGTHAEDGVTVHAYADNNNDGAADNTTSLGSSTVSGNSWSFSVNLTANAANNFVVRAEDGAGNLSSDEDVPTITEDSSRPTLDSSIPADNAPAIVVGNNLTLTFNEAITFGSGTIKIIDLDNGSSTVTIDVTSPGTQASISGKVLTLNPSSDLKYSTNYAVQIEATAIEDLYSNVYTGIADNTTLNFYTEDPVITFSATSSSGAESVPSADLTVKISAVSPRDVTVNYTVGGTATGGTDYTLVNGTLTITAGNQNNVISIANIVNDLLVETNETVIVSIASPSNASLGTNTTHTYTILDDDQATVTIADVSGNEDDGAIVVTAILDNPVAGGFSVDVSTSDGTATAGVDYFAVSNQTLFFAGTANEDKRFTVTPKKDSNPESNETVNISMSNLGGTGLAASKFEITDVGILTIKDDDASQISVSDQTLAEASTNMTFTVSLDKSGIAPITVDYATSDGTAEAGSDYTSVSGTLTFASGETSKSVIVPISGDNILEADESFTVTLSNVTGTANLLDGSVTGVIENDDAASVTIADVAANEDAGTVTVTASLNNGVQGGFTVNASTTDGTATTTDSDYTAITGEVLTFVGTAGETQAFDITIGSDTKLEANETLTVAMSTLAATTLAVDITDQATVTITNDDDASVTIADVSGNEDDGAITITATLDNPVDGEFSVDVSTSDGTATAGVDYFAVSSQTLIFAGTANETKTFTVTPKVDSDPEANETVNITVGNLAATSLAVDITDAAVLTIIDDDASSISIDNPTIAEGSSGNTELTFTVSLDKPQIAAVTVDYAVTGGTATSGDDYTILADGTLTFAAGETSKTVVISVIGDTNVEPNETIELTLTNATGAASIADASGTATITNDDSAAVTIADISANEDDGTVTVTASLNNGVQGGFTVNASTTDGTATTTDSDYTAISGEVLTFAGTAGETQTFDITLGTDTKLEANETLTVAMSTLAATTLGVDITDQATVTITNDDDASVTIADVSGNEDDGAITITATLDNPVDRGFSVDVSTSDGTATAGVDYFAVSNQTLFFAGTANETKTFTVTPKVDSDPEANETVNITVGNLAATSLAVDITDAAVLTIIDDDASSISIDNPTIAEGSSGNTELTFTVSLDKPQIAAVTVDYAVTGGTATSGDDYTILADGTLTFAAGETSKTVVISVIGDTNVEPNETIELTLTNATGAASIADASGTATITNDDSAAVTIADISANEDDGTVTVTASLNNGVQGGFTVNASTTDGTATTTDSDYTAISGEVLTFAGTAGETQTFDITLGTDTKLEANETLTVAMSTLAATTLGVDITDQATVTITNDDDASVTIADVSGNEDDGAITITATLDNPVDRGFSVDVSTSDGTATAGVDYFAVSNQTLFFVGTANETKTFTVTPKVDSNPESNETVNITVGNLAATSLAVDITNAAVLTIIDDDASSISIDDPTIAEGSSGNTDLTFTVSLDKAGTAPITVDYSITGGTATSEDDYTILADGTLTFAAGETSKTVVISVIGDTNVEPNETIELTLTNATGAALIADASGTATITNDDSAAVTIADISANEDDGTVTVTASLNNGVQGGFTVNASTTDGTATTTDSDYTAISGEVLTFVGTAGETQAFDITLGTDTKLEANETLTVAMSTLAATTLGIDITDQATVTITNDDDASVTIADVSGNEDDGAITITATLDNPVDGEFSVDVSTSDGTATAGVDYFAVSSQTLIFAGTANETKTFTVTPKVDSDPEANETVNITVGNLAATSLAVDITDAAVLTIIDDDASSISIDNPTIAEGSSGNTDLTFTVSLDKPQIAAVTVDYAVTGGTATSGDDYTILADGTLTFAAGETSKTVVISVIGDTNVETNETIELTLTNATGAALIADASGTATITNDDSAAVTIADISANEDAGTVTVTASLNNGVQGGFTVNASTTDGTATTTDSDYTAISGEVLTFAGTAGETQTFDITLGSDTKLEANETLTVAISTLAATTLGVDITDQATVTITNDDNASLTIANVSGNEDDGAITVTAVLDNPVAGGFSVNYASADGTATSSDDYTSVSGTLTFAGTVSESQEFTIVPTADLIDEGDETISISLASLSGTMLPVSISDEATITILDDDNTPVITTGQTFSIDETIVNDHEVGMILATDTDAGTTFSNWTITEGNGDGIFAINSSTGEITVTDNTKLDYETKTSYSLTVTVSDGTNISAGETVTVNVNNINDNTPVVTASQSFDVDEDAANATSVGTVAATDADAGTTLSDWTITEGDGDGIFAINSSTGEITVTDNTKLDYETRTSYYLTVTVSDGSHTSSSETISITVNDVFEKSDQNITFSQLADLTYGDSDFNLTATASSGLPVSYSSSNTSVATIDGNTVTIMGAGSTTITASQSGNASYNAATDVQQVLIVMPKALTIMADDKTKVYDGMVYSPFTVSYAGFVTGEDDTDLGGALTFSGTATTATDVRSDYVITPGGVISDNYAITFVDGTLSITKAAQIITFNEIPLKHSETDPDFNLDATSSSGLAVTYSYSHSSATAPAEVSPTGFVSLLASGEVEITVSQEGDNNYLPAEPVTRTMTIESSDASIHSVTINGVTYDSPDQEIYYLIDCNDEKDKVEIDFSTEANATGNTGLNFEIETPTPGIYRKEIQVTSQDDTNTRTYRVVVEKRFNYEDIVIQKYNNVLLVNNNPETNGGYRFTSFNWYKDGVLIGTGQYYSVGDNASDQLDLNAMYSVEMETEDGDILSTCESSITLKSAFVLKVAPNPVHSGSTIDVTTTYSTEMLTDLKITVSNLYGLQVMQEVSGSNNSRITLPSSLTPGTYVVSTKAGDVELSTKIIVQ